MTPDDSLAALLEALRAQAGEGTRTERAARIEGTADESSGSTG